jgi:hypothetical protein
MPKLTPEPDSTDGESQKIKNKKNNAYKALILCCT